MSGDWYDEYAKEKKKKRRSKAELALINDPQDCARAARKALDESNYERAYELANEVIKRDTRIAETYYVRGAALFYSAFGEEAKAVSDLETARKMGFKSPKMYQVLAKLYDSRKQYKKAIEVLTEGMQVAPENELWRFRAAMYQSTGDHESALDDLTTYINHRPNKSIGYHLRANLYEVQGKYDKALADYASCIKFNPRNTRTMAIRAKLLAKMGRDKEAIENISQVFAIDENDDDAYRFRGDMYARAQQYDKAIADYTRAIEISPEYARASYEARAKVYEKIGKPALAEKDRLEASRQASKPAEKPVYELK